MKSKYYVLGYNIGYVNKLSKHCLNYSLTFNLLNFYETLLKKNPVDFGLDPHVLLGRVS